MTASSTIKNPPVLYTVQEVGAMLKVHPQTVRDLHRNGELGFIKAGKRHLTSADQLDKFIHAHSSD